MSKHIVKKYKEFRDQYIKGETDLAKLRQDVKGYLEVSREEFLKLFTGLEKKFHTAMRNIEPLNNPQRYIYTLHFILNNREEVLNIIEDIILIFEDVSFYNNNIKLDSWVSVSDEERAYAYMETDNCIYNERGWNESNFRDGYIAFRFCIELYDGIIDTWRGKSPSEIKSYLNRLESAIENDESLDLLFGNNPDFNILSSYS
jgi:hypothetical protein